MPTESEKFTLFAGCTFKRAMDCVTRVLCWSLMFTDALTLVEDDCAVFGWLGCCAVLVLVLLVPALGACCAWLFVAGGLLVWA